MQAIQLFEHFIKKKIRSVQNCSLLVKMANETIPIYGDAKKKEGYFKH